MSKLQATTLSKYYQRLMVLGTAIFMGVTVLTVWIGWERQEAIEVARARQQVYETSLHLEAVIKAARDQIAQLVQWSSQFERQTPYTGATPLRDALTKAINQSPDGAFNLDSLASRPEQERLGQMMGLASVQRPIAPYRVSHLDLAVSLLDRMGSGQRTSDFLRWTYFFSAGENLLATTPWASSKDMLSGAPNIQDYLHHSWQDYDVTRMGLPASNPQRRAYWTPAYVDQAGAGLMVSHAQPIYWEDHFVGIVATDVLLNFLNDLLKTFPDQDGTLLVSNEYKQVLALRGKSAQDKNSIAMLDSVLPANLKSIERVESYNGSFHDGQLLLSATLSNPRWSIIFMLPKDVIRWRILKSYSTQIQLALALVISAVVVNMFLWRMYVAPSLQVAGYVARATKEDAKEPADLPAAWVPWVHELAQAFSERRRLFHELEQTNAALEQKVAERTQELVNANAKLVQQANTDALTGAYNRRFLLDLMETEVERIRRGGKPMSVLLIDLDHFKRINDNYGHDAGDAVLREFTARAIASVRTMDRICRYGGEEFVALLPECTASDAMEVGERLRQQIAAVPMQHGSHVIPVTVSIGAAQFQPEDHPESLLKHADEMLYKAKAQGRNQVVLWSGNERGL